MLLFLKYLSRSVHEERRLDQSEPENIYNGNNGVCESLTVWRKSLLFSCNGFTVIDSRGNLKYRVDNYVLRPEETILMDALGQSVLTLRRCKKLRLIDSWLIYEGEVGDDQNCMTTRNSLSTSKSTKKPSFQVRKNINIFHTNPANVLAYIYRMVSDQRQIVYVIEGSYNHRSCKILDASTRLVVAEIKKKEAIIGGGISFGQDVFSLIVNPGFDSGFAMALVLLLDQMF